MTVARKLQKSINISNVMYSMNITSLNFEEGKKILYFLLKEKATADHLVTP